MNDIYHIHVHRTNRTVLAAARDPASFQLGDDVRIRAVR